MLLGLPLSLLFFLSRDTERRNAVLSANVFLTCGIGLIWSGFLLLGGYAWFTTLLHNPGMSEYGWLAAALGLMRICTASFGPCLYATNRHLQSAWISIAFTILNLLATALAFQWYGTIWHILAAQLVVIACFVPLKFGMMFAAIAGRLTMASLAEMQKQLQHGFNLGLGTVIGGLHKQMDSFLVALMTNPADYAVFTNGAQEVPLVSVVQGSVTAAILPDMTRLFGSHEKDKAHALWVRATVKVAWILFPATAVLICLSQEIMTFVFSSRYRESGSILAIYLMLLPLRSVSYGAVCIAADRNDLIRNGALLGFLTNVVMSVVFIPLLGAKGAAIATVCTFGFVLIPWYMRKLAGLFEVPIGNILPWVQIFYISLLSTALFATLRILLTFFTPWRNIAGGL